MISRRTSVICGLLLMVAAGVAGATQEQSASLKLTGSAATLSQVADFGDGPRVPLSELGGRLGVIVTVAGRNINIVRRDGSELRLKGAFAGDPRLPVASDAILIRDGEAWALPEEALPLLGLAETGRQGPRPSAMGRDGSAPGAFQAFEVAKPAVARPAPRPPATSPHARVLPNLATNSPAESGWVEVYPVEVEVGIGRTSTFTSQGMTGFYQQVIGPAAGSTGYQPRELEPRSPVSTTMSHLHLETADGDRFFAVGDVFHPLWGTATGIEVESAISEHSRVAASVMVPSDTRGEHPDGRFALRASTASPAGLATEAAIGADGSYFASGSWEGQRLSLRSSIAERSDLSRRDVWCQHRPLPSVTMFGRVSEVAGLYEARAKLLGVHWRLGRAHVGVERTQGTSFGEPWATDAISVSLLRGQASGVVRYLVPREGTGRAGLELSLSRCDSLGRQVFFSSSAPGNTELGASRSYRLGTSMPVGKDLRARTALDWGASGIHPEGKLEWRPSRDRMVALRYGVLDFGAPGTTAGRALVLQASWAFGEAGEGPRGTGHVVGTVKDDSGLGIADVIVVLDGETTAVTAPDGSYRFDGVDLGRHLVKLDPARLHTDLGGLLQTRAVFVSQNEPGRADFLLTRLCQIAGQVYVKDARSDYREPLASVVVELSSGVQATTDSGGRYRFVGLKPGRYTVGVASTTDLSALMPIPPTSWSFNLRPGENATGADFAFERRQRHIIFAVLPAS